VEVDQDDPDVGGPLPQRYTAGTALQPDDLHRHR
jgi:hypothetical protein